MRPIALAAALAGLAFAPAPFPRSRDRGPDDLARLQGTWVRVLHNGRAQSGSDVVVVRDNVWRYNTPRDSWVMTLDAKGAPKRIDLVRVGEKNSFFRGIYRLEGDTFTYSLRLNATEQQRPTDYRTTDPHSWVSVYKRLSR